MSDEARFNYRPQPNGPLATRVRRCQVMMAKVDIMIEDRDAVTDLSREPDLTDFPAWACQFFGANLSTEDADRVEADDDEDELYPREDYGLSKEEWAEMDRLNEVHGTEFYRDDDLLTLRRLDAERWISQTYGLNDNEDINHVEVQNPEEENPDTKNQNNWFEVDEVAVPSQSSVQYDNSIKALGWWNEKYEHYGDSHGKHGRQNTFWRRTIRKNRGHRRQFWGDMLDETEDPASHLEGVLNDWYAHEAFLSNLKFVAIDEAYHRGEFSDNWLQTSHFNSREHYLKVA